MLLIITWKLALKLTLWINELGYRPAHHDKKVSVYVAELRSKRWN